MSRQTNRELPCKERCGRTAVVRGYCRPCYLRSQYPTSPRKRVDTTCLVCGLKLRVWEGQRYCKTHVRFRSTEAPSALVGSPMRRSVEFQSPEPEDLLLWAARSITIYRPDGTADEERTAHERGRWLTRKLQGSWTEEAA